MKLNAGISIGLLGLGALCSDATLAQHRVANAGAAAFGNPWNTRGRYIVEGPTSLLAQTSVVRVGGKVFSQLDIIHGVAADLTQAQANELQSSGNLRLFKDRSVGTEGKKLPLAAPGRATVLTDGTAVVAKKNQYETNYPILVGADILQSQGIIGSGVTIAVLDTGVWTGGADHFDERILASVDLLNNNNPVDGDLYGHGTHITSIAASSNITHSGHYFGIAPGANLVIVRAFDGEGQGSYTNVIAGLNWTLAPAHNRIIGMIRSTRQ